MFTNFHLNTFFRRVGKKWVGKVKGISWCGQLVLPEFSFFLKKFKFSFNSEKMDESIRPVCDPIGDLVCRN